MAGRPFVIRSFGRLSVTGVLLLAAGCQTTSTVRSEATITVSAAASLTDAFTQIGADFAAANPGVEVTFNFDGSSILATQIIQGAPADVYASADEHNMARLTDDDVIAGEPEVFARNELVVVTKAGNPRAIKGLSDLAAAGVVSLCAKEAPCGRYTAEVLERSRVAIPESSVTRGQNATATLTAVTEGDAVAGIVYASDAFRAGDSVHTILVPAEHNVLARYLIGTRAGSDTAAAFVSYVMSHRGQATLEEFGFLRAA